MTSPVTEIPDDGEWPRIDHFIAAADFHHTGTPDENRALERLIERARHSGAVLLILGDFFNYWLGRRHYELETYRDTLELLRSATQAGQPIALVPGNRDFLLDAEFQARTGVEVIRDEFQFECGSARVHCSHGDLLASSDLMYQGARKLFHSSFLRELSRRLPRVVIERIARALRQNSSKKLEGLAEDRYPPDLTMVGELVEAGAELVLCGHFHRRIWREVSASPRRGLFVIVEPYEERGYFVEGRSGEWTEHRLRS